MSTVLLVFAAVSAVSNFLVLLSYRYEKKLHSNFVILIVNQAVADFIVSIIPMTLYTVNILVGFDAHRLQKTPRTVVEMVIKDTDVSD